MIRLMGTEFFKLRKRVITKVLLAILVVIPVLVYLALFAATNSVVSISPQSPDMDAVRGVLGLRMALPFGYELMTFVGVILAMILVAGTVGSEYGWGTITTLLVCCESRMRFLTSKLMVVAGLVLGGMVVLLLACIIMSLITTALIGGSFSLDFVNGSYLWAQFQQFWRTYFVVMLFTLMAFFFAVWGRSTLAGIGLGIGVFIVEGIVTSFLRVTRGWVSHIPQALFSANVDSIMAPNLQWLPSGLHVGMGGEAQRLLGNMPGGGQAALVMGAYAVLFLGLAVYFFNKRDISPSPS